ncbi:restriction endonuclease subunit S (plasmid) [Rhizobium ruizarguesonis]|nr:restriction endonuclease subunit S [Rhizobium ruizarguesonis]
MRINIGSIARWQGDSDILVSPDYVVFRCKGAGPNRLDPSYLDHFRRSAAWEEFVSEKGDGSVRVRIYYKDLARLQLALPSFPEQQKIADCIDSSDVLIEAQGRKVEVLKAHKKGLTQRLFPRPERIENGVKIPADTIPRLRFPEFRTAGDWGRGELGPKTDKVGSGITPNGGDRNYRSSGRPFVRSQNVGWGELLLDDVACLDEETHNSFASTEIRLGDVLLNITGASIGRSAVADRRIVGGNVNQHVCIIRVKQKEIDQFYLNQYLISQYGQKQIDNFQAGGNRQGLNFAQIRTFSIPLPPKMPEQHRIAECLTSLDDLINAENQKLDNLKSHKKGLMQQLFSSFAEADA